MSFAAFHFAEPRWLWLAAAGAGFAGAVALARRERAPRTTGADGFAAFCRLNSRRRTARPGGGSRNTAALAVAFAGLALARPQWGSVESAKTWVGEDVVFVLDCSCSMMTTDVLPSRLERAKFAILDFVQRQSHGRVGLVAFAGSAFIQCPLTFDYGAFEETLMAVDDNTIPIPGTDIGRALNEAYRAIGQRQPPQIDRAGDRRRGFGTVKADGDQQVSSGLYAARHLATNGVVVFTIGVGTPAGKEIQYVNAAGQRELVRDAKGNIVRSRLDETTLREIARGHRRQLFSARRARRRPDASAPGDSRAGCRQRLARVREKRRGPFSLVHRGHAGAPGRRIAHRHAAEKFSGIIMKLLAPFESKAVFPLPMNRSDCRQVLDCAGPLALSDCAGLEKRQRAAALPDAVAPASARFVSRPLWTIREVLKRSMNLTLVGTSRGDVPARIIAGGTVAPLNVARTAQRAVPNGFRGSRRNLFRRILFLGDRAG